MKTKSIFAAIALLFGIGASATTATINYEQGDVTAKLDKIIKNFDTLHFQESIEIDWSMWGTCKSGVIQIPGFAVCYDEPLMVEDFGQEPMKVQSVGVRFAFAPEKNGFTRKEEDSISTFGWSNVLKFSILGQIFDDNAWCFDNSAISMPFLSFLDPTYDGVLSVNAYAELFLLLSPFTIYLQALDCGMASVDKYTDSLSKTGENIDYLRMGLPQFLGCWNSFTAGGWSQNPDPIIQGTSVSAYGLAAMHRVGVLKKTVRIKGMDGSVLPDSMCGPRIEPSFLKTQYYYTLVTPGVSETVPIGAIASEWAEFKNDPSANDESVAWIWSRKCFYLGAAKCNEN